MDTPETPQTPPQADALETLVGDVSPAPGKDEKMLAMLCHLLGSLVGFLVPLIIWLVKKEAMPFVDDQGREALNFQLTMLIVFVAAGFLSFLTCGLGSIVFLPLWVADIVFGVMGATKANRGEAYRYPVVIRMIQ